MTGQIIQLSHDTHNIAELDISSQEGANSALGSIDNALMYVLAERASLGAIENRLDHTVNNLSNVVTNTSAAKGRIEDADFAAESTKLTRAQILAQASTSMLAQANQSKQYVLSLLQDMKSATECQLTSVSWHSSCSLK